MRSFFSRFSLIIPLVLCALMVASESGRFTIKNAETDLSIAAIDIAEGNPVKTGTDRVITFTIDPAPGPTITISTIYDEVTKFYVGAEEVVLPASHLIWVRDSYKWIVAKTSNGDYAIYPHDSDVYWSQNTTIAPEIDLILGPSIRGKEAFWALQGVH